MHILALTLQYQKRLNATFKHHNFYPLVFQNRNSFSSDRTCRTALSQLTSKNIQQQQYISLFPNEVYYTLPNNADGVKKVRIVGECFQYGPGHCIRNHNLNITMTSFVQCRPQQLNTVTYSVIIISYHIISYISSVLITG